MTPAERAVIEKALRWWDDRDAWADDALYFAVINLRDERAAKTPAERAEMPLTYGQVVEGDEVLSVKLNRWYAVSATVLRADGMVRVTMPKTGRPAAKGRPQINAWHDFDPAKPCRVRRGISGEAVDMIVSVLYSGPDTVTRKDAPEATADPELAGAAHDPEATVPEDEQEEVIEP
jgi:hypothetical protein